MKKRKSEGSYNSKRPKRNVLNRQQSFGSGLSWREETELQKALYASLHETKRSKSFDDSSDTFNKLSNELKISMSRNKVHAQRKFAQGSNPSSPINTPIKTRNNLCAVNAVDVLPLKKPTTEDFLTFLCLRGTSVLPSSMDYLSDEYKSQTIACQNDDFDDCSTSNTSDELADRSYHYDCVNAVRKSVLQSPTKQCFTRSNTTLQTHKITNLSSNKRIFQKRSITTKLVHKAKNIPNKKDSAKKEEVKLSSWSALREKYKEKRLNSQKSLEKKSKPLKKTKASLEARVTRSRSDIATTSLNVSNQSRLRLAKLKPSIIEYASSESSGDESSIDVIPEKAPLSKKKKVSCRKTSIKTEFLAKKSSSCYKSVTRKNVENKDNNSKGKEQALALVPRNRKRKSLAMEIMEAAGSASSSSSSSSSSDSESEFKVLRNSKKVVSVQTKSCIVKQKVKHEIKTFKKSKKKKKKKKKKLMKKLKKRKKDKKSKCEKRKVLRSSDCFEKASGSGKTRKSSESNCEERNIVSALRSKKNCHSTGVSGQESKASSSNKSSPKSNRPKDLIKTKKSKISVASKRQNADFSSDSDFEPEKVTKKKEEPATAAAIDIDSLIEFSSSDDSLYEELMFLTRRASKELSPKTPSYLDYQASGGSSQNPSSNTRVSTTIARRSLCIESKVKKGDETSTMKSQLIESMTKTMCDASTNTYDNDMDEDSMIFDRGPPLPTSVLSSKSVSVSNSGTSPMRKMAQNENYPSCLSIDEVTCKVSKPFPSAKNSVGEIIDAPVFYPSVDEFKDPMEYISKISLQAEKYGICTIIPPPSFKPECRLNDDMRFTSHSQHLHQLYKRWGQNVKQHACIAKHLESQGVSFEQVPLIGGLELDLCKLYQSVQQLGGLQQVIQKNKWPKIAELLHIPQTLKMDKGTRLYDIYCKYLVSYDTLPEEEKKKIEREVVNSLDCKKDSYHSEDAILKGKSMPLSQFYRNSRNLSQMWSKIEGVATHAVEDEFWKIVEDREDHVVVYAANIDSSIYKSGFPSNVRNSSFAKHPWNLKVMTNNPASILQYIGQISGITIPTLHIGMLFTAGCWYQDPHCLPWIEYLHSGSQKVWYGIPSNFDEKFRNVMKSVVPEVCHSGPLWLPSDTSFVPPSLLCKQGVSVSKITQEAGQFVVVFPKAYVATIGCGYNISESVYFAYPEWLDGALKAFQDLNDSCEPSTFSLDKLIINICNESKISKVTLEKTLPLIENLRETERKYRKQLSELGLKSCAYLPWNDATSKKKKLRLNDVDKDVEEECTVCQSFCHVSMVVNSFQDCIYCLKHAVSHIQKKKNLKHCKLLYMYEIDEFDAMIKKIKQQVGSKGKQLTRKLSKR